VGLNVRCLALICWTVANWAFSFAFGSQLVSHWLKVNDQSDTVIGYSHASYYFGMAVASFAVPALMRARSPIRIVTIGMIFSSITLAVFPWVESESGWYALRFLNGWSGAMCVIPLETIVSRDAEPARKTQAFAYYGVAITIGGALGFVLAQPTAALGAVSAFLIGAIIPLNAMVVLALTLRGEFHPVPDGAAATPLGLRTNFLSYGTAWCQGFLEGGMVAFLQLFLIWRGFSGEEAGRLMGITTVGVILFQLPVSWLADRYGKTPVLLACYAIVALGLLTIPEVTHPIGLAAILFTFGACTGAMYPLGLALLGDRVPANALARAYAWYLVVECFGCLAGAALMGKARDGWGETAMFSVGFTAVILVLSSALVLPAFQRWRRLSHVHPTERRDNEIAHSGRD
jgi:MFS family permease